MATTYKKGKLQKTTGSDIEVRYPETTLDKVVAWVNGSTAGVTILDGGRIKKDYLPSSAVYTDSNGKIDSGVIPQLTTSIISGGVFTSNFLPSNTVYTSGGKVDSGVIPNLSATIISGGTFGTSLLPNIPVSQIATSGGTLAIAIVPDIPATKLTGVINKSNLPGSVDDIVELIAVAASAPSATGVVIGDQYFNTTSKKIMTAVSDGSWTNATASDPDGSVIYYVPSTETSYRYGKSSMVEIAAQRAVITEVRPAGSGEGYASDDFVPTELAVRNAITSAGTPFATQSEVDAEVITTKAVSPATLAGAANVMHLVPLFDMGETISDIDADEAFVGSKFYLSQGGYICTVTSVSGSTILYDQASPVRSAAYSFDSNIWVWNGHEMVPLGSPKASATTYGIVKLRYDETSGDAVLSCDDKEWIRDGLAEAFTVTTTHGLSFTNRALDLSLDIVGGTISGSTIFCDLEWAAD